MDNNTIINEESNTGTKAEEIYRVSVTKTASDSLDAIVDRVNDGFEAGKVNRTQTVAWVLTHFLKNLTDGSVQEIRADHFDEVSLLEAMLKQAKKTGKLPSELKGVLMRQSGIDTPIKKSREKNSAA